LKHGVQNYNVHARSQKVKKNNLHKIWLINGKQIKH